MHTFKDSGGTVWPIDLPIGTVNRVRAESDGRFNLWKPDSLVDDQRLMKVLWDDLPTLWELLWLIVAPQAEEQGVSAEDFGLLMAADCLIDAQIAFHREWSDFFQRLQKPDQALALEKMTAYRAKAVELTREKLRTDPELKTLDQRVTKKLTATLNNSFGKLQDSLASILEDSPGDKST